MRLVCLLTISLLGALSASANEPREWTDVQGRTMQASFIERQGPAIWVRRDGRLFQIPLERLSEGDRAWVQAQTAGSPPSPAASAEPAGPGSTASPAESTGRAPEWPNAASGRDTFELSVVREDSEAEKFIYRSKHFEFISEERLDFNVVRDFALTFEATFQAVDALPVGLAPAPPDGYFQTRLFRSRISYHHAGGPENSGGAYFRSKKQIWVPLEALGVERTSSGFSLDRDRDNALLIHEITHQVMHRWLADIPVWVSEGFAVFVESLPYRRGEFRFKRQDLEAFFKRRLGQADPVVLLHPSDVMNLTHEKWWDNMADPGNQSRQYASSFALIQYFLFGDEEPPQRLYAYFRDLEAGKKHSEAVKRLLRGRTAGQLADDIRDYFRKEGVKVAFKRA